jgi:hypothetical protein
MSSDVQYMLTDGSFSKSDPCTMYESFYKTVKLQLYGTMWKETHWFIDSYISAYIQTLYRVTGVHPSGLTINQGCRQVSTGLPPSSGLGWKEKRSEV